MYIPELDHHCDLMNKEFKSIDLMDIETSELVFTDDGIAARAAKHEEFPADMVMSSKPKLSVILKWRS